MKVLTHRYTELFQGRFKVLGHFADQVFAAPNLRLFFKLLAENVVPLLSKGTSYETFYLHWTKEKANFKKKHSETETAALQELLDVLEKIQSLLDRENLLEHPAINERLSTIENILKGADGYRFVMPPHYEAVYDHICLLCKDVLQLGHIELMKEFGEIVFTNEAIVDPETQNVTYAQVPGFSGFSFAPIRSKLRALNQVFSWDNIDHEWAIWEHLELARWCWDTPASYFEDKKLEYQTIQTCDKSAFLLNMHAFWVEMHQIKTKIDFQKHILFFDRDRFVQYLEIILNKILLHQEIGLDQYSGQEKAPYSLMLRLDDNELQLEAIWVKDADPEIFVVHTFRRDSSPYRMIKQLLDVSIGDHVSVENYATESVAKIFDRIKLNPIVEKLFFRRVDQHTVSPINRCPVLKDLPQNELDEVNAYIKSLESIEGGWYRNRLLYAQGDSL
jgi:hypothetical protein